MKKEILFGMGVAALVVFFMHILKKRKKASWKCMPEMVFCVYSVLLIELVGIQSFKFSFDGTMNFNLIPLVGSSFWCC